MLFKHRFESDDIHERAEFLRSLAFDWQVVEEAEKNRLKDQLRLCLRTDKEDVFKAESWFKVGLEIVVTVTRESSR